MRESLRDIRLCSLRDATQLFSRKKKKMIRLSFLGAFLAFGLILAKGPSYLMEASFKEQTETNNADSRDFVKQLFSGAVSSSSMQTKSLMTSRVVLRLVIENLGLQAEFRQGSFWVRGLRRLADVMRAERRRPLAEVETFRFQNLRYEEDRALYLTFFFIDREHFELYQGKRKLGSGTLGAFFALPEVQFTLKEIPKNLRLRKHYSVRIHPWQETVRSLRKKIQITPQKTNPSVYDLTISSPDRIGGASLLNELMAQFQRYLQDDHSAFAEQQLAYLTKRQKELFSQFEDELKTQACDMSRHLADEGCLNLSQELQVFLTSHAKMREKSLALDLELERLEGGSPIQEDSLLFSNLQDRYAELRALQQERDLLEISISSSEFGVLAPDEKGQEALLQELKNLREEKKRAQLGLDRLRQGVVDPDLIVASWAKTLQEADPQSQQRKDLQEHLSHWVHLLSVREKIATERSLHSGQTLPEFEGMDWEMARDLCKDYMHQLDESEKYSRSMTQALQQIQSEGVELGCFASSLKDPMSQHLIASADVLSRQLKEDKYCSAKEALRWKEDLALQRHLLQEHLEQSLQVELTQSRLMREKLAMLQQVSLDCLHRHISVAQEGVQAEIAKRHVELLQEKKLLDQQMKALRFQLAQLPEKWQAQQLFELKSKAHQGMMETMIQLVETKTISHHLHQVGSKPIDLASLPLLPIFPYASLAFFLGAFLAGGGYFFTSFLKAAFRGFSMNGEKLQKLGLSFSGPLSSSCDGPFVKHLFGSDVETLRSLCLFADAAPKAHVLGLMGGKGPDFSFVLASRAALFGKRVCLVHCDFSKTFQAKDLPGLLQFLEGQVSEIPIRSFEGFDYLPSGGYSELGAEWIQSFSFCALLDQLKPRYDLILLYFRSPLNFSESKAVLKISDKIVVFLQGEQIDLLTPFISWAYDEEYRRLTFIASQ